MKKLSQILIPDHLLLNLKQDNKKNVLETMLNTLTVPHLRRSKAKILKRIAEREDLDSTGIGGGLAFPHARIDKASELTMLIGRSIEGLDWGSIDEKPVNLVFMILWQPEIPGLFNQLFATLIRQLRNRDFMLALLNASTADEVIQHLSNIEVDIKEPSEFTLGSFSLLLKLQDEEKNGPTQQSALLREEIHEALLERYDKLRRRYQQPVVHVKNGVCTGCFLKVSTGLMSKVRGQTDTLVCENCGRFIGFTS